MTDPNHRLKRRAAKILALALNNPSKEEAAAAMRMVRKLISKHGFTLDELRAPTVDKRFGSSNTASAQMPPPFSSLCLAKAASLLTDTVFVLDCTTNTILFRGMTRGILAGAKTGLDPQVAAEASRRLAE